MKNFLFVLVTLLATFSSFAELEITEFLPNPEDKDDLTKPLGEWVELYNNGNEVVDIVSFVLKDNKDDHRLPISETKLMRGTKVQPGEYILVYRDGDSDFSLNNNGIDEVRLFSDDILLDSVSYTDTTEGMSWSKVEGQWFQTKPTPGEDNVFSEQCDWSLDLEGTTITRDKVEFTIEAKRLLGFPQEITVQGEIQDLFGKTVKTYSPWTGKKVTTQVSKAYSPRLQEGTFKVSFWMQNVSCAERDSSNNVASSIIVVNPQFRQNQSHLQIETIYLGNDDRAAWGDQVRVKVNIYKGDETKQVAQLWVERDGEKVSKTTKLNIVDKYKNYSLTVPIQLEANCNEKIEGGEVTLVLDAFGLREEKTLPIRGVNKEICRDYLAYVKDLQTDKAQGSTHAGQVSYKADLPPSIKTGTALHIPVEITNDEQEREYTVWAYLFRGSKCYSCHDSAVARDSNKQLITLQAQDQETVNLLLKIDDVAEGEYKLKVKIRKDDQKTVNEITKSIFVEGLEEKKNEQTLVTSAAAVTEPAEASPPATKIHQGPGIIIYESSSEKARKLIPTLLAITFGLLVVVLVWQK